MLYWNLKQKNLEKKKTPFQLIKEKCRILDPAIGNFQPFVLDEMNTWPGIHYQEKSVLYVADEVSVFMPKVLTQKFFKKQIQNLCFYLSRRKSKIRLLTSSSS
jgi:hypothetical protein